MKQRNRSYKLKKELSLFSTVLLGIGIILGAGIYALIGVGAEVAGNMLWAAFAISAIVAIFTGLSYAELSSIFSKDAAEYNYTKQAFGKEWLSFGVSWVLIVAGVISAATVAIGFAGYFSHIFGGNINLIAFGLVVIMSILNYFGMRDSARFNNIASLIEAAGLILVIIIGIFFLGKSNTNFFEMPAAGFAGLMSAVSIIFFAYIGFENLANLSEEVKNPRKTLPKALVISLIISTILYILVSVASVEILGAEKLAASKAPLTEVVTKAIPNASLLMSIIALFATGNTVLIILIVVSRILYGMSNQHSLPKFCSAVGKRGTPYVAIALVGIVTALFAALGNLKLIASVTDLGVFIAYFFVNLALIKLRYKKGYIGSGFRSPSIGRFPILALFGLITSVILFFYFDLYVWFLELLSIVLGFIIYRAFKRNQKYKLSKRFST